MMPYGYNPNRSDHYRPDYPPPNMGGQYSGYPYMNYQNPEHHHSKKHKKHKRDRDRDGYRGDYYNPMPPPYAQGPYQQPMYPPQGNQMYQGMPPQYGGGQYQGYGNQYPPQYGSPYQQGYNPYNEPTNSPAGFLAKAEPIMELIRVLGPQLSGLRSILPF